MPMSFPAGISRSRCLVFTAVMMAAAGPRASAQQATVPSEAQHARATEAAGAIHVDGVLDEEGWGRAEWVTGFRQKDPDEGAAAGVPTAVAFLYDGQALYIGARMTSGSAGELQSLMGRRDNAGSSERILFSLDTYHDRRTAYTFGVTAAGVRLDYYHPSDNEHNRDFSFDPVWVAKTNTTADGWVAEVRIPFSQLRFNALPEQVWGLNINRYIPGRNEDDYWVMIPKNQTGWSSRFGTLSGITGVEPSRRLELQPYVATNATVTGEGGAGNPFDDGRNLSARAGGDLKMGLGPNLTLDATVNPDFGQVEADPAEVNLSAVETFFSERRPFFTEGANLLQGGGSAYYYSRRIGAAPRGPASGDYVDRPEAATILGAAKVTGRLSSGMSGGALLAVTDQEEARTYDAATQTFGRSRVAPLTGYGVVRAQQEFGPSASTVGVILTGVERRLEDGHPLESILTRQAFSGGTDLNLRFQGGKYVLSAALGFSYISGDTAAIRRVQQSSAHYFQRPDQDHVTFDPTRTSLFGWQADLDFSKNGGEHWLWEAGIGVESPAFEINDLGRLGNADDIDAYAGIRYRENTPGRVFRSWNVGLFGFGGLNFGGIRQYNGVELGGNVSFLNFWSAYVELGLEPGAYSDALTRGGPLMRTTNDHRISGGVESPFSGSTQFELGVDYVWDEIGGWYYEIQPEFSFRPSQRLELSVEPSYSRLKDKRQYITQRPGGPAATFGNRYLFGTIGRSTLAAQFRVNYAVTPDLTLELYAEPFAASGQYYHVGQLAAPKTNDLQRFGRDIGSVAATDSTLTFSDGADTFTLSPNFNVLSFRSNLVVRWEWRPGSTLFLVWQQNRERSASTGRRIGTGDFLDAFGTAGDNFFAVKVTYWLPVS